MVFGRHKDAGKSSQLCPTTGRNLSDNTHPDYDPATDPELRLRVVHTVAESILETTQEEDRRRFKRSASRKDKDHNENGSSLKPKRTLFGRRKRAGTVTSSRGHGDSVVGGGEEQEDPTIEVGYEERAELERTRTRMVAAAEAEESARRQEKQDAEERKKSAKKRGKKEKGRRVVYVNVEGAKTDPRGYERNKVRTSKYTAVSFLPKNLTEQFRRVANIYFLALVILQIFSIFGATSPQVAMLPLLAILVITGFKDGLEDLRRHTLDNEVNNSAVTRLGDWHNVNAPEDIRPWWAFWRASNPNHKLSRGVRKLREKEGSYDAGFLYADQPLAAESRDSFGVNGSMAKSGSSYTLDTDNGTSSYPPRLLRSATLEATQSRSGGSTSPSVNTSSGRKSLSDVVSYDQATPGTAKWERTLWKKLEVGDVVLLKENDQIPADVVVLATSDPDGVCFVETKNLDGETNLKPRKALKATMGIGNEEDIEHAKFWIDSEAPHANLYSFNAVLRWRSKEEKPGMEHPVIEHREIGASQEQQEAITINELLLRGTQLRNTSWCIGIVCFTGADTKIMLNQGETPSKRSKIEKETNFNVLINFLVLILLCIGCAVGGGVYDGISGRSATFYEPGGEYSDNAIANAFITFGAALVLFQNIVPISLVITVELVKTIQAYFIYSDIDMYYEPLDHPCVPKTWNISDDLGQIEYIFSDKTGTLTQNIMEFQKCAVGGVSYGEGITEAMLGAAKREGRDTSAFEPSQNEGHLSARKAQTCEILRSGFNNVFMQEDKVTLISPPMAEELARRGTVQHERLAAFWRALAICHTVLVDRPNDDDHNIVEYKAESPDEAALVSAARDAGFVFLNRTNQEVEIDVLGARERYVPLRTLAFNSARKRMSTLVRCPDGRILLICKGADSVIYQRLAADHDQAVMEKTTQQLEEFANAGLRTLCISSRYLSDGEFQQWSKTYDKACAAVDDREDEIERACELVEKDLTILGATALEDKLQEGVPEAIAQLHKAGIKLWILTGDKLQTAIEIGFSCNLLTNEMDIMILSAESEEGTRAQIEAGLDKVNRSLSGLAPLDTDVHGEKIGGATKKDGFAVVIDGETLRYALEDSLKPMFLELTTQCNAVVCCRVSPSQKALTVKLVKDGKNAMTLAIGDGANDVAMIQEAHIGVGIAGLEGAQASMSADYAVGQFRYLNKLLLVHGRWCYIRIADMHANFFYKNIVWTLTLFLYQFFCNFDSTYLYDYTLIMLFNLIFTSLPVAVLGIFDQDISAKVSLAFPQLYRRGILGQEWTRPTFFGFMLDGLYQAGVCFFIPFFVFAWSTSHSVEGHDISVWEFGTTVAACAVTAANLFVGLHIRYWSWIAWVVIVGSCLAFHVWIAIYSQFPVFTFENELIYLYSTLFFWTSMVLTQVACIGPKYLWMYVRSAYWPRDSDIVREMEILGRRGKGPLAYDLERSGGNSDIAPFTTPQPPLEVREHLPLVDVNGRQRNPSAETESEGPPTPLDDRFGFNTAPQAFSTSARSQLGFDSAASSPSLLTFSPNPAQHSHPVPAIHIHDSTPRTSFATSPTPHSPNRASAASDFDVLDYAQNRESTWGAQGGFTEADLQSRSPLDQAHQQWVSSSSSAGGGDESFVSATQSPVGSAPVSPQYGSTSQQQQYQPGHYHQPSHSSGTGFAM